MNNNQDWGKISFPFSPFRFNKDINNNQDWGKISFPFSPFRFNFKK